MLSKEINYLQTVEMTYYEKKCMYNKESKKKLINMLIEANNMIDTLLAQSNSIRTGALIK